MSQYQIYTIRNTKNGKMYIGLTVGSTANMLNWILVKCKREPNLYLGLQKSVKEHGRDYHVFQRTQKIFNSKEEGEKVLKRLQTGLQKRGLLLNDYVVSIEKYTCEVCGIESKLVHKEKHDRDLCIKKTNEVLDEIMEEEEVEVEEVDPNLGY